ncbi:Hypothetical protein, putative, partial [Bodo saltans]
DDDNESPLPRSTSARVARESVLTSTSPLSVVSGNSDSKRADLPLWHRDQSQEGPSPAAAPPAVVATTVEPAGGSLAPVGGAVSIESSTYACSPSSIPAARTPSWSVQAGGTHMSNATPQDGDDSATTDSQQRGAAYYHHRNNNNNVIGGGSHIISKKQGHHLTISTTFQPSSGASGPLPVQLVVAGGGGGAGATGSGGHFSPQMASFVFPSNFSMEGASGHHQHLVVASSPSGAGGGGRRRSFQGVVPQIYTNFASEMDNNNGGGHEDDVKGAIPRYFPNKRLSTRNTMDVLQYFNAASGGGGVQGQPSPAPPPVVVAGMVHNNSNMALSMSDPAGALGYNGYDDPLEGSHTSIGSLAGQRAVLTNNVKVESDELGTTTVNDYVIEELLGRGSYGIVFSGMNKDGDKVAIKCIRRTQLFKRPPPATSYTDVATTSASASPMVGSIPPTPHNNSHDPMLLQAVGPTGTLSSLSRATSSSRPDNSFQLPAQSSVAQNALQQLHMANLQQHHVSSYNANASPQQTMGAASPRVGGGMMQYVRSLTEGEGNRNAADFIYLDYNILKEVAIMKQVNNRHIKAEVLR